MYVEGIKMNFLCEYIFKRDQCMYIFFSELFKVILVNKETFAATSSWYLTSAFADTSNNRIEWPDFITPSLYVYMYADAYLYQSLRKKYLHTDTWFVQNSLKWNTFTNCHSEYLYYCFEIESSLIFFLITNMKFNDLKLKFNR